MKKIIFSIFFVLIAFSAKAGCDDPIGDGVDYTKCRFSESQDLAGSYLPNSNLSFSSFIKVNFDKSIMINSILAFGMFSESSFIRANLYEANLQGANFERSDFSSANLTRVNFQGATLIGANFKNANLVEADFTSSNILESNFEGANLNDAVWDDGQKCKNGSIGKCIKWIITSRIVICLDFCFRMTNKKGHSTLVRFKKTPNLLSFLVVNLQQIQKT